MASRACGVAVRIIDRLKGLHMAQIEVEGNKVTIKLDRDYKNDEEKLNQASKELQRELVKRGYTRP